MQEHLAKIMILNKEDETKLMPFFSIGYVAVVGIPIILNRIEAQKYYFYSLRVQNNHVTFNVVYLKNTPEVTFLLQEIFNRSTQTKSNFKWGRNVHK